VARVLDFRVDLDEELQSWILFFATVSALWLFCLPFFCEGLSFQFARSCAVCMKQHLPLFLLAICLLDAGGLALLISWLPAWTVSEYVKFAVQIATWFAGFAMETASAALLIAVACTALCFKDKLMQLLGLDHQVLVNWKLRDALGCMVGTHFRPIEINIWKVEDLPPGDFFSANNVYVEMYLGYNEAMRTRVHNNAGNGCLLKETLQLNFDEGDEEETLHIFVRSQRLLGVSDLGRAEVSAEKLRELISQSRASNRFSWNQGSFGESSHTIQLIPRGTLHMRASYVQDEV
jgi:hypothetical protein